MRLIMENEIIEKEHDWNEDYPAEKYHIEFLKERIERLEMENDALLREMGY